MDILPNNYYRSYYFYFTFEQKRKSIDEKKFYRYPNKYEWFVLSIIIGIILPFFLQKIGFSTTYSINALVSALIFIAAILVDIDNKLLDNKKELNKLKHEKSIYEIATRKKHRSFELFWEISLILAEAGYYEKLDQFSFNVPKVKFPEFWQNALIFSENKWLCTDYFNPNYPWGYGWTNDRALEFQKLTIEDGSVKRVFIFDAEENINKDAIDFMNSHINAGIKTRWILKKGNDNRLYE